jgi:hypothetical protein
MKRSAWLSLLGAIVWASLLLPGAIYLPIGQPAEVWFGPSGTSTSRVPLVQLNGHGILIVVAIPLVLSLLAGLSLIVHARTVWQPARWAAWTVTGGVFAGAALGTVTFLIGIFVLPVGLLLAVACANVSPSERTRRTGSSPGLASVQDGEPKRAS